MAKRFPFNRMINFFFIVSQVLVKHHCKDKRLYTMRKVKCSIRVGIVTV